ncbi:zinc finger bed domain-containing protein 1-like [Gigaspora margarita]|uniref:Zinc finger bed domain-containing protein 1-like n=1 Tax=Gigaspora margarita TaxID=4874 RepID=A0A8H4ESG0_GIGMA|nr:zinc finger bed domain-containing protein 1-like [Gigaspora margarita]
MAKLHAYYVTNARHELNYVGQNLLESDFLQMMQNYTHSLTSDDLEDNPITNEVDSNILEIENSINLNLALNHTD